LDKIYDKYAVYYDILHSDKSYSKECEFVEQMFKTFSTSLPKTVLDVGCGTGNHAIIFAKKGYEITGIDASAGMVNHAQRKAVESGLNIDFKTMDMTDIKLEKKFDACIVMFGAIGYLKSYDALRKAFIGIKNHLTEDGILIFDYWNGPAVLTLRPSTVNKDIKHNDTRILRSATPKLDFENNVCSVNYHCIVLEKNKIIDEFIEVHRLQFYFPTDIHYHLDTCGFKVIKTMPFMKAEEPIDDKNWNLITIARPKNTKT